MSETIENGKAYAIQILVASELGLTNRGVDFAKLHLKNKLFPLQFSQLELAAKEAVERIQQAKMESKAQELVAKYL